MKSAHFSANAARVRGEPGLALPVTVDCRYAPEVVSQKWSPRKNRITLDYEHDMALRAPGSEVAMPSQCATRTLVARLHFARRKQQPAATAPNDCPWICGVSERQTATAKISNPYECPCENRNSKF